MANEKNDQIPETNENTAAETPQDAQTRNRKPIKRILVQRVGHIEGGIRPGYVLRKVGQAFMVMPTGPRMKEYKGMITLNETGAFLFEEMQKPEPSLEKLIQACVDKYDDTSWEEANDAVLSFLNQCCNCNLIEFDEKFINQDGEEMTREELGLE